MHHDQTVQFDELLTANDVSHLIGVSPSLLNEWALAADEGGVAQGPPHLRISSKRRRWRAGDVAAWLDSRRVGG